MTTLKKTFGRSTVVLPNVPWVGPPVSRTVTGPKTLTPWFPPSPWSDVAVPLPPRTEDGRVLRDFAGNELRVGDRVAYSLAKPVRLLIKEIVRFSNSGRSAVFADGTHRELTLVVKVFG